MFQPKASDPDGDVLTFSADNLPPWAKLDPKTGRISGRPGASDVGEYESITITVADGARRAVTSPFTITVLEGAPVVATLRWQVPLTKCDGTPLDNLAGYRIVYGRSAQDMDRSVFIDDPNQTEYAFEGLSSGDWYFAVIGINENGLEGPPTAPARKSI